MPGDLRDRIAEAASKNGRSMNSEIVARLEESFASQMTAIDAALIQKEASLEFAMEIAARRFSGIESSIKNALDEQVMALKEEVSQLRALTRRQNKSS